VSISFSGTVFLGYDTKVKTNSDIGKMSNGGFYLAYNHQLASKLLNSENLSIDLGTSISANPMKSESGDIPVKINIASLYFLPIYNISQKLSLSYKMGYNVFSSDFFKSKGGLLYGFSINFKLSDNIYVGLNKVTNIAKLKYNYNHNDYYNETLGYVERNSELKIKRTMVTLGYTF
tara:strand:- start:64 stop:591 length:528 start_codon:yes stop_codon:yes gene_type:complete